MRRFIGLLVLVVAVISPALGAAASDDGMELGGTNGLKAYVTKRAGRIRVSRDVMTRNGTKNTGDVEISIDQIQEVDSNLEPLTKNAKQSSFAMVDFNVSKVTNFSIPNAPGVIADCLTCAGTLRETGSVISLGVCAIKTNGTLTMNGEVTNVVAGQLKITFTMSSWGAWQNDSNKLAVDINIKTPPNREIVNGSDTHKKPTKFSLGGDAFMEFSRMVNQDNRWYTMPDRYPLYKSKGANNVFRLIFDHFNTTAVYDPNVEVGYPVDSTSTDAASTVVVSVLPLLAAAFLQILVRV